MEIEKFIQHAVEAMGFDRLTFMQKETLEIGISGANLLLLSPTGSGKTIAFLLPIIVRALDQNNERANFPNGVGANNIRPKTCDNVCNNAGYLGECYSPLHALIIVPSRELALQIDEVFHKLKPGFRSICCYGGHDIRKETETLSSVKENENILLICTSGRLKDHIERGNINLSAIKTVVLDEYDKSLELGFEEEMKFILSKLSSREQLILTSATRAMEIAKWLNFKGYKELDYLPKGATFDAKYELSEKLEVFQVKSPIADKLETLEELLCSLDDDAQIIVFSNYRESSERISHFLTEHGIENALYHGGLEQEYREKALARFRGNSIRVLVSTDLASRGLDIPDVQHIVHYHIPAEEETFVHRNGRTARAGASGTAYLIVGPNEFVPSYIKKKPPFFKGKREKGEGINSQQTSPLSPLPSPFLPAPYSLIYIGRGKKDKISKGDVLGFFTKNAGIDGSAIGRIDIYERCAYCAIRRDLASSVVEKVKGLKIKGEKTHYLIVK